MNKAYKVVFNETTGTYVAVAEIVSARGKASSTQEVSTVITAVPQSFTGRFMGKVMMALLGLTTVLAMPLAHASYTAGGGIVSGSNSNGSIAIGSFGNASTGVGAGGSGGTAATAGSSVNSVAIGSGATTDQSYGYSVALGNNSKVGGGPTDGDGVAVGSNTQAYAHGVAIGSNAISDQVGNAAKTGTVAIGSFSHVNNADGGIAIGVYAKTGGSSHYATVIGANAEGTAANTVAVGAKSVASSANGVAIGVESLANSTRGVAIGWQAKAVGGSSAFGSTAVGTLAYAENSGALALGNQAKAEAAFSIASGYMSKASASQAIATGESSLASGANAIAFGFGAQATGTNNYAIGTGAQALGGYSTAIGNNSYAEGKTYGSAIAIGPNANAISDAGDSVYRNVAIAIGENATARKSGIAIGFNAQAPQNGAVALGWGADATGSLSGVVIGDRAKATGNNAIAIGGNADKTATFANGTGAMAVGSGANAMGTGTVALGGLGGTAGGSVATKDFAVAIGAAAQATNIGAVAIGGDDTNIAKASGKNSVAIGSKTQALGENSLAFGTGSTAGTTGSIAVGVNSSASGEGSVVIGNANKATNKNTFILGNGIQSTQDNSVILGNASTDSVATKETGITLNGTAYAFAGQGSTLNGVVSVGSATKERQLKYVAAGKVAADSTDGINGSQLYSAYSAITASNKSGLNFSGNAGATVHRDLGQTLAIVGATGVSTGVTPLVFDTTTAATKGTYSAKNLQTVADGNGNIQIQMAERPVFDTVTANTVAGITVTAGATGSNTVILDGNGLTIDNTNKAGGTITIADGNVNFGGNTLSNVGNAVNGTDAVNLNQLQAAANAATLHYLSVNDGGVQNGNYDNKGASGNNAIALGVNALALKTKGVAIGYLSNAFEDNATAVGNETFAGNKSSALGHYAKANGVSATAMTGGNAYGNNAIAIGEVATAGADMIAIGYNAGKRSTGIQNVFIGSGAGDVATGAGSAGAFNTAVGHLSFYGGAGAENSYFGSYSGNQATGSHNSVVGHYSGSKVTGDYNSVYGYNAGKNVTGDNNIAVGTAAGSNVSGSHNISIGYLAGPTTGVNTDNAIAIGKYATADATDAMALGNNAVVNSVNSVALGSNSIANAAVGTATGIIAGTTYNFAGVSPVGTISVGELNTERTITNVAAGRLTVNSTDAINGSQLYAVQTGLESALAGTSSDLTSLGLNFAGNAGSTIHKDLGQTLSIKGEASTTGTYSGKNINTVTDNNGNIQIQMAERPEFTSIQTGSTATGNFSVLDQSGLNVYTTGTVISIKDGDVNFGGNTLGGVGAGVNPDDAINKGQLDNLGDHLAGDIFGGNAAYDGNTITWSNIGGTGANTIDGAINTVNNKVNLGWNAADTAGNSFNVAAGQTVGFINSDGNLDITAAGSSLTFDLANDINVNSVTAEDGLGNKTVLGTTGTSVSDAAGNSAHYGANSSSFTDLAGNSSVSSATGTTLTDAAGNTYITTAAGSVLTNAAGDQTNLSAAGTYVQDALGNNATYGANGISIGNTTGTVINIADGNVNFGGNTLGGVGAGVNPDDAINKGQLDNLGDHLAGDIFGGNAAYDGNTITWSNIGGTGANTIDGAINTVNNKVNLGWNAADTAGNSFNVAAGQTVGFINSDGNLDITAAGSSLTFDLANDINVNSVTAEDGLGNKTVLGTTGTSVSDAAGNSAHYGANSSSFTDTAGNSSVSSATGTTLTDAAGNTYLTTAAGSVLTNTNGDQTNLSAAGTYVQDALGNNATYGANGISIGNTTGTVINIKDGDVNFGGNVVTGVGAGTIGTGSTDAINGGQMFDFGSSIANGLGGNSKFDAATNQVITALNVGGNTYNSVQGALDAVGQVAGSGWNVSTNGGTASNVAPGATVDFGNADGNVQISNKGGNITVDLADNLKVDSIEVGGNKLDQNGLTVGNTTVGKDSVTVGDTSITTDGITIAGGPSVTKNGIDAGGKVISNVADGVADGDAVNVGQLNKAINDSNTVINKNIDDIKNDIGDIDDLFDTFDVSGQTTTDRKNLVDTINAINTTGVKYAHTNDGGDASKIGTTNDSSAGGKNSSAFGVGAIVEAGADSSVAMGHNTFVSSNATNAVAIGSGSKAMGESAIALGHGSEASGKQSISIGTGNKVTGNHSGAIGDPNTVSGNESYALGNNNTISADKSFVVGNNVSIDAKASDMSAANGATFNGSIALGNGSTVSAPVGTASTTIQGTKYDFAGSKPVGTVSVGSAGEERTVTNVAAGRIEKDSTDAVNGSQLYATNKAIENIQTGGAGVVQYSDAANPNKSNGGKPSNNATLVGADVNAPVTLSNVADGKAPNDAVNVKQMQEMGAGLNNRIDAVEDNANAGTATAMAVAGLPQAYMPGKSMVAMSGGVYRGESGYAVGYSTISEGGNWVIKAAASGNSQGYFGGTAGVGYQW